MVLAEVQCTTTIQSALAMILIIRTVMRIAITNSYWMVTNLELEIETRLMSLHQKRKKATVRAPRI